MSDRLRPGGLSRRAAFLAALGVLAVWGALWSPQLFRGRVFIRGDASAFRVFAETSRARWLLVHERTFFSPYVFAGLPTTASLADPRPQWLPDPLLDLWEAPGRAAAWPPLLPVLLVHLVSMLAAGALARALWGGGAWSFLTAALTWGLSSFVALPIAYGHDAQFLALAWFPVALYLTHRLFAAPTRRAAAFAGLGLALAIGMLGLAGHPQYKIYFVPLVLVFACERAWSLKRAPRLAGVGLALAGGAALSAAVWLPALLYRAQSVRASAWGGVGLDEVGRWSLAPRDAWSFLWPHAVGFGGAAYRGGLAFAEYPPYLGIAALALVLIGVPARGDPDRRPWWTWALVAGCALALAFGTRLGPAYGFLYEHIPFWSTVRAAVGTVGIAQLAIALLAARGMARLVGAHASNRARRQRALAVIAGFALALGAIALFGNKTAAPDLAPAAASLARGDLALRATLLLLVALVALVALRAPASRGVSLAVLVALLVFDLGSVAIPVLARATGDRAALRSPAPCPLARVARSDPHARVAPLDKPSFLSNDPACWGVRSLGGLHGAAPRRWNSLRERNLLGRYGVMCALGVKWVASDTVAIDDPELFAPVADVHGVSRVLHALPRAYGVPRVEAPGNDEAVLAALGADEFAPDRVAYASEASAAGDYPGASEIAIDWIEDGADVIELSTRSEGAAFVVVADAWFPGWSATIDRSAVPLYRVNDFIRGVIVPTGGHRVRLSYEPDGWRTAILVSRAAWAAALALLLGLALFPRLARRRAGAAA